MKQYIMITNFLLTSIAVVQAADGKGIIGKPTGMLDPRKKRHLEKTLSLRGGPNENSAPGNRGAGRDLWGYGQDPYYGYQDPYGYNGYDPYGGYMKVKKPAGKKGGFVQKNPYSYGGNDYNMYGGNDYNMYGGNDYNMYKDPMNYPEDPYYPGDSMYYPTEKYGHHPGFGKGKKAKKAKTKNSKTMPKPRPPPRPPKDDCRFAKHLVENPFNNEWQYICDDDDCEMLVTEEVFRFQEADAVVVAGGGSGNNTNTTVIGSYYIWGDQLIQDQQGGALDARISGTCFRTTPGGSPSSTAHCSFTIRDLEDDQISISGVLSGFGGNLVINGGSGSFAGMIGDAIITPVTIGNGDPLDDAIIYEVTLIIGYIVCPAQSVLDSDYHV